MIYKVYLIERYILELHAGDEILFLALIGVAVHGPGERREPPLHLLPEQSHTLDRLLPQMDIAIRNPAREIVRVNQIAGNILPGKEYQVRCNSNRQRGPHDNEHVRFPAKPRSVFGFKGRVLVKKENRGPELRTIGRQIPGKNRPFQRKILDAAEVEPTPGRGDFSQLAVKMDHFPAAGPFMEVIDILGDHRHVMDALQFRHDPVRLVRADRQKLPSSLVVEGKNPVRILMERGCRAELQGIGLPPQPVRIPEGA